MSKSTTIDTKEVADRLKVHPNTVYKLAHDPRGAKQLGATKVGGQFRFSAAKIDKICEGS